MRSKRCEIRIPWPIYELAEARSSELGYRNLGRYFLGMTIADVFLSGWGARMRNIANSDPDVQDFLVEQILRMPVEQVELAAFLKRLISGGPGPRNGKKSARRPAKRKRGKKKLTSKLQRELAGIAGAGGGGVLGR